MELRKLYFVVFLIWNFSAIFIFAFGYHNIDLSYNHRDSIDCNSFNCVSTDQRYSLGLDGILWAFFMIIAEIIWLSSNIVLKPLQMVKIEGKLKKQPKYHYP
jgi:hypothetical protein